MLWGVAAQSVNGLGVLQHSANRVGGWLQRSANGWGVVAAQCQLSANCLGVLQHSANA
jgi:hypothetical protein